MKKTSQASDKPDTYGCRKMTGRSNTSISPTNKAETRKQTSYPASKGYIYTLEVMLATATILATLILIFATVPEEAETNLAVMKQTGYDALFYMDQNNELRNAVSKGSLSSINNNLSKIFPTSVDFDTSVCTVSCNSTEIPANRTIIVVDYYIGGYREIYINKKVRLWIWEKF